MLETAREFGLEQLMASGEEEAIREWHAQWYLALATTLAPLVHLAGDPARLGRLSAEHGNLRAALGWFAARGDAESLARFTGALNWYWHVTQGHEGRVWLEQALAASAHASPEARMGALSGASNLAVQQGDHVRATALAEELLALARAEGDQVAEADARFLLSRAAGQRGAGAEATAYSPRRRRHCTGRWATSAGCPGRCSASASRPMSLVTSRRRLGSLEKHSRGSGQ